MDIAERVEVARRAWNDGDLDGYLELYDEAIQLHGYAPTPMDKAAVVDFYRTIWSALGVGGAPPLEFHEVLVDGDLYCCRFTMRGVHRGEFLGLPPTGTSVALEGITILRFAGDRVVERWSTADFLGMLMQIGAFPAPV